jgi:hypothetical protein
MRLQPTFSAVFMASMTAMATPAFSQEEDDKGFFGLGWLDQTRDFSANRADAMAQSLDRFFGVPRSDVEAAYSSLRLITETRMSELDDDDFRVRLRGTVHLPGITERLRLIFSEDQGEGTTYYSQNELLDRPRSTRLNLELNLGENDNHRIDFRVGLRSSLKLRTSVSYRYTKPVGDKYFNRFSQSLYFIDGKGFGTFSQYQLDRSFGNDTILRWSNELKAEESFNGIEWSSSLQQLWRVSDSGGLSAFIRVAGKTDQDFTGLYQVGLRVRQNIARPWLFWELGPGYTWEKTASNLPREGGAFIVGRLEMAIGRQN